MRSTTKIGVFALVTVMALMSSANAASWTTESGISFTYNSTTGHWYGLTSPGTWLDALDAAKDAGVAATVGTALDLGSTTAWTGSLVTINDAAENLWLTQVIPTSPDWYSWNGWSWNQSFDEHAWIGYTDAASEGTWVWEDGTPAGYENWGTYADPIWDEPNGGTLENWAALRGDVDGTWNDYNPFMYTPWDMGSIPGIIELAPVHAPAPGAFLIAGLGTACVGYLRRRRAV